MEFTFELKAEDYTGYRKVMPSAWWYPWLAVAIVAPSLVSLYVGGFRVTLYIVGAALAMLLIGGFRAAARLRRQEFIHNRCTPVTIRATPQYLEVDGTVEWRRMHWSYVDRLRVQRGWLAVTFFEGDPLVIPPRCLDEAQRTQLVAECEAATKDAGNRETAELQVRRELDDEEPRTEIGYTIDNQYMRGLVELRFADRVGWTRVVMTLAATAVVAAVWTSARTQVIAAGLAVAIPLAGLRLLELALKRHTIKRCELQHRLPMRLALHDDGYERRCPLFQAFTSWSLVRSVDVHREYLIFSHFDNEHLLAPSSACREASRNDVPLSLDPAEFASEAMALAQRWNQEEEPAPEDEGTAVDSDIAHGDLLEPRTRDSTNSADSTDSTERSDS